MGAPLGFEARLYLDIADSWDAPDWQEIPNVKDCKVNAKPDKAETTTRGDGGVKTFKPGLNDVSITFDAINDKEDPQLLLLREKFASRGMIHVMALDGPIDEAGSYGPEFWGNLFDNSRDEALSEAQKVSLEIAPTRAPAVDERLRWVTTA